MKIEKKRRFYRFGYPCPVREDTDPGPFQVRDGAAFAELTEPLRSAGWDYETLICNYPFREDCGDVPMGAERFPFLQPEDCLVLATRPPLDDHQSGNRKQIPRSRSHLESAIFGEMRAFFGYSCREQIRLTRRWADRLTSSAETSISEVAARYHFRQTHDARISKRGPLDPDRPAKSASPLDYRSLGFFIHLPAIRHYGCRLIASFSIGGFETLVWNRIVRIRHGHWLSRPCFVMAELDLNRMPQLPVTLHSADEVPARILIEEGLGSP